MLWLFLLRHLLPGVRQVEHHVTGKCVANGFGATLTVDKEKS